MSPSSSNERGSGAFWRIADIILAFLNASDGSLNEFAPVERIEMSPSSEDTETCDR